MASPHIEKQIKEESKKDKSLKVEMVVAVNMARRSDDKIIKARPFFNSGIQYFINTRNILEEYEKMNKRQSNRLQRRPAVVVVEYFKVLKIYFLKLIDLIR